MSSLRLVAAVNFAIGVASATVAAQPHQVFLVRPDRMGPITGKTKLERKTLERLFKGYRVKQESREMYSIYDDRRRILKVYAHEGNTIAIASDPVFRTEDDLGVGSSLEDVKRKHQDLSCDESHERSGPEPGDLLRCQTAVLPTATFGFFLLSNGKPSTMKWMDLAIASVQAVDSVPPVLRLRVSVKSNGLLTTVAEIPGEASSPVPSTAQLQVDAQEAMRFDGMAVVVEVRGTQAKRYVTRELKNANMYEPVLSVTASDLGTGAVMLCAAISPKFLAEQVDSLAALERAQRLASSTYCGSITVAAVPGP